MPVYTFNKIALPLTLAISLTCMKPGVAGTQPPSLFSDNAQPMMDSTSVPYSGDKTIVKSRLVKVNLGLLDSADTNGSSPSITLNLFDGKELTAEEINIEKTSGGALITGKLKDEPLSNVTIVTNGDIVAGNISAPGKRYHIRYIAPGVHAVQEVDPSRFPEDEPFVPVPENLPETTEADSSISPNAATREYIKVGIVYSDDVETAVGGREAVKTLAKLAIAETNTSYRNSRVKHRLRFGGLKKVNYTESGNLGTDLNCITSTTDSCLDAIHSWRDLREADVISFWVENGGNYCGVGWLMTTVSSAFAPYAFNVVDRECATGYYSFGHEIGHNLGLRHDPYVDANTTPFTYGHGHTHPVPDSTGWRTVMAYNNACSAQNSYCYRLQYFSNPNVSYDGDPTGDRTTENNKRALTQTMPVAAAFR